MPSPRIRFRKSKKAKKNGPVRAEELQSLKDELLMLAALKNDEDASAGLVEVSKSISIEVDDKETVEKVVEKARNEAMFELDLLVAECTGTSGEEGYDVVSLSGIDVEEDGYCEEEAAIVTSKSIKPVASKKSKKAKTDRKEQEDAKKSVANTQKKTAKKDAKPKAPSPKPAASMSLPASPKSAAKKSVSESQKKTTKIASSKPAVKSNATKAQPQKKASTRRKDAGPVASALKIYEPSNKKRDNSMALTVTSAAKTTSSASKRPSSGDDDDDCTVATLPTLATKLVAAQAKYISAAAHHKAVEAEKMLEYKVAILKLKDEQAKERLEQRVADMAAKEKAKREEKERKKAMLEAEAEAKREEKLMRKEQMLAEARARQEEKREEKEMKKMEKVAIKEEKMVAKKQQKASKVKEAAVKELEMALEKVEHAREIATRIEEDPYCDIDEMSVLSGRSVFSSSRSVFSKKSRSAVRRGNKTKGLFKKNGDKTSIAARIASVGAPVSSIGPEARDDDGTSLLDEVSLLQTTVAQLQDQLMSAIQPSTSTKAVSFEDELRESHSTALYPGRWGGPEVRDEAPTDDAGCLAGWMQMFMGEAEAEAEAEATEAEATSCTSSYDEPSVRETRMSRTSSRASRLKGLRFI